VAHARSLGGARGRTAGRADGGPRRRTSTS